MKKNVIILVVILFLLLIAGGFGFWFWKISSNKIGECLITTSTKCNNLNKIQVNELAKATRLEFDSSGNDKIFAPISGKCKKSTSVYNGDGNVYENIGITGIFNNKNVIFSFVFNSGLSCPSENIKKGELLGFIKKNPMSDYNNHDLIIMALSEKTESNYSYYDIDEQLLNKFIK